MTSTPDSKKRRVSLSLVGSGDEEVEQQQALVEVKTAATVEDFVLSAPPDESKLSEAVGVHAIPPPDESKLSPIHKILLTDLWSDDRNEVMNGFIKLEYFCGSSKNHISEVRLKKRASIQKAGGSLAIVGTLKKWYGDPEIQARGFIALALCGQKSDLFWGPAREAGALDLVVAAMDNYPKELFVQEAGCAVLQFASFSRDNAERIVSAVGGVGAIIEAMKKFQFALILQRNACSALDRLSDWDDFKEHIVDAGALVALATVIETFRNGKSGDAKSTVHRARAALKRLI